MATETSGAFETALKRLEEIVARLEHETIGLDESVALFREGKTLSTLCERLLREAQEAIEAAARGDAPPEPAAGAQPPRPPADRPPARVITPSPALFGSGDVADADPDL